MLTALLVAVLATLLGVALALLPAASSGLLGPIRTFALTASLAVLLVHLLPEGFATLGAPALLVFAAGALLPIVLERSAGRIVRRASDRQQRSLLALEVGYAGLLVHKIGDGLALGAYGGPLGHGEPQLDVMIALAAHTVPVVAVVVLVFGATRGRSSGFVRAAGIALSIVAGVLLAGLVPAERVQAASAWVAAAVAGLLLHVVMHDLGAHPPRDARERTLDFVFALLGVALPFAGHFEGAHEHGSDESGALVTAFASSFVDLVFDTAPLLVLGVTVVVVLRCTVERTATSRLWASAPRLALALVFAAPELRLETIGLGVSFLGWRFALLRLAAALSVALAIAWAVMRVAGSSARELAGSEIETRSRAPLAVLAEELRLLGPWLVVGLGAAALVETLLPPRVFTAIDRPLLELAVVTVVALPSYVCPAAATPLAAVLIAKGLSPGAVLTGLVLGALVSARMLSALGRTHGVRAVLPVLGVSVALSWLSGLATNLLLPKVEVHAHGVVAHAAHGTLAIACGVLFALLVTTSIWQSGLRGWLASLGRRGASSRDATSGHAHVH